MDGGYPYRVVQRGQQEADHGGVDAGEGGTETAVCPQPLPQRQDADEQQEGGQEDRNQGEQSAAPAARRPGHDRAQVGGKGEQRPRHRLCHTVTGDELVAGDPSRRDHLRLQQRQHHVAAAEHQRSGAVEPVEYA